MSEFDKLEGEAEKFGEKEAENKLGVGQNQGQQDQGQYGQRPGPAGPGPAGPGPVRRGPRPAASARVLGRCLKCAKPRRPPSRCDRGSSPPAAAWPGLLRAAARGWRFLCGTRFAPLIVILGRDTALDRLMIVVAGR